MLSALRDFMARVAYAAKDAGIWWGIAISLALALVSLAIAAAVVVTWPADQFKAGVRSGFWSRRSPAVRVLGIAGKNLGGVILVLVGLVMSLPGIPGQGILTMIIGLTLIDFPGKHALEARLVGRPWVLRKLNGLRRRFHRPPLEL
jgi:hypothetical protein